MEVEKSMVIMGGGGIRGLIGNRKNTIKIKFKIKKHAYIP